jgi:hypothetical protein
MSRQPCRYNTRSPTGRPPLPDRRLPPTRSLRASTSAVQNLFRSRGPVDGSSFCEPNRAIAPLLPASRRPVPNPLAFGFHRLPLFVIDAIKVPPESATASRAASRQQSMRESACGAAQRTSDCGVSMFCADTREAGPDLGRNLVTLQRTHLVTSAWRLRNQP